MTIQPVVKQETAKIAAGVCILAVLMIAVFLIIGRFDYTVLLGAALGCAVAVGNFFLMALSVQRAADAMQPAAAGEEAEGETDEEENAEKPLSEDAKRAKKRMQLSYTLRMLLMAAVAVLAAVLPFINIYAALIPLLFPRIVISAIGLIQKNQKEA